MRAVFLILTALTAFATSACEQDDESFDGALRDTPARTAAEDPGLPLDTARFEPLRAAGDAAIEGMMWVSESPPEQADGISLTAQLRGVPPRAYGWAVHRGDCSAPDDLVLALGWGTEASRGRDRTGGPLGEMRPAFEPSLEGEVAETIWVPLNGALDRQRLIDEPHSVRIHPEPGDDQVHPAVACAPLPDLSLAEGGPGS